jgi:hypothetical protein
MTKRKKNKLPLGVKLFLVRMWAFVFTFLPLGIGIGLNADKYFATREAGLSLTCGGVMAAAIVVICMLGKAKSVFGSGVVVCGVIWVMSILLKPLILNLQFLTGMLLIGYIIHAVVFKPWIKSLQRRIAARDNARAFKEEGVV